MVIADAVSLQPAIDLGFKIVESAVATVVPIVVAWFLSRYLHIQAQSALGQRIISVASNAAAFGLAEAQKEADANATPIDINNSAIRKGVDYLNSAISSKTLEAAEITVPVNQIVTAQLQKLLPSETQAAVIKTPPVPTA